MNSLLGSGIGDHDFGIYFWLADTYFEMELRSEDWYSEVIIEFVSNTVLEVSILYTVARVLLTEAADWVDRVLSDTVVGTGIVLGWP